MTNDKYTINGYFVNEFTAEFTAERAMVLYHPRAGGLNAGPSCS
jgi:hypothetical protein